MRAFALLPLLSVFLSAPSWAQGEKLEIKADLPLTADANHAAVIETAAERDKRMKWWRDAKFGTNK